MARIVGMDVSRGEVTCCVLEAAPPPDLLEFARSYKPIKVKSADAEQLLGLGEIFILEPTGSDHRIFAEVIRKAKKPVLGVTGIRVRGFAKNHGILNKSDREDAAVIAAYGWYHLAAGNEKAFISITASEIRESFLTMQALKKQKTALINQIRSRLSYEVPELHDAELKLRPWGSGLPPRFVRVVAGHQVDTKGMALPESTVGRGISVITQQLGQQAHDIEMLIYAIECECEALMDGDRFSIYRQVFTEWGIYGKTAIAILAAIFPIEQFLDEDGRQVYKRVYASEKSKHNRTTRNRSLKQFKRAIGAGRMWIQSGKKEFWMPTGDSSIRASIFKFLDLLVTVRRQPSVARLCKKYPELQDLLDKAPSKRRKKAIIQDNYSLEAMLKKWMPDSCSNEKEPWKNKELIRKTAEFTGVSDRMAELQLFYQLAPQCQNKCKTEKIMKVYPRFVTHLFRDLVDAFQRSGCFRSESNTE